MTITVALDLRPLSLPEKSQRGTGQVIRPLLEHVGCSNDDCRFLLLLAQDQEPPAIPPRCEPCILPWEYGDISRSDWHRESWRTGRFLSRLAPDVYHAPDLYLPRGYSGRILVTVCDYYDLPLVGPVHIFGHTYGWRWNVRFRWRYRLTWSGLARHADRVATISHTTAKRIAARFPRLKHKLRPIPLGIEEGWLLPPTGSDIADELGLSRPMVLHVGGLEARKNPGGVLGAFERLRRERPEATLVLAGPPHGPKAEAPGIRNLGYVSREDLKRLYAAADVLLFPSHDEGFGLPVVEALAQGCPVVTSRGTATEEVAAGRATLVDPTDQEEIYRALVRTLEAPRPAPAHDLRRAADVAAAYLQLYRELAAASSASITP